MFQAASPIGRRSSHQCHVAEPSIVNRWEKASASVLEDLQALKVGTFDPKLSPAEEKYYFVQFARMHKRGCCASLVLKARTVEKSTVDYKHVPGKAPYLLQLMPRPAGPRHPAAPPMRLMRIYFAEPQDPSDVLLLLHVATKEDSEEGLAEQDSAMLQAKERAEIYAFNEARDASK